MSHVSPRKSHSAHTPFAGLSTASAIAIVCAALITGALISVYTGEISWPLMLAFSVGTIVTTTVVNPRGLFLTVALAPFLFVVAVAAAGVFITAGGPTGITRTDVLVILYPLVQLFPVLAATIAGAALIAVARLALLRRHNEAIARQERAQRRRAARSNRRVATEGRRAREKTMSVQELRELMEQRDRRR